MITKIKILIFGILIIVALTVPEFFMSHICAGEPTEPHDADAMWIEPSNIELNTDEHAIGYKFNVTLCINLTETSNSWQFMLIYNKNYLNATRCGYTAGYKSQFFGGLGTIGVEPSFAIYNSTHDYVLHAETILMEPFRAPGYGTLSWIEFEVMAAPEPSETIASELDISTETPEETYALDENDQKIALNAYNATYVFMSTVPPPPPPSTGTAIYVEPEELIDPTMVPSSTFRINITVVNATDLKTCEFNMSYNTAIISWISVTVFKVNGQTPTPSTIMNDEAGFIWLKLKYSTPVTITDPQPLVEIGFHVDAFGVTPLDLHDTALINSEGEPIEHETRDGFFGTLIIDVAIVNIEAPRPWVYRGWILNINVTVKNEGNTSETFLVKAYYNSHLIGNMTVENLPPGNQSTVTLQWSTGDAAPCTNYILSAEIPPVPNEADLSDNSFVDGAVKVRILGDVDGNDKVDIADVRTVAIAFGSNPNRPRWNPDADLDQNQKIDIYDVWLAAKSFGTSCQ